MKKIKQLYKLSRNKEKAKIFRLFAFAEIFCILMTSIAFLLLVGSIICKCLEVQVPNYLSYALPVLCAGAVGYFTNFIAVKMLFEPYQRTDRHWLKFLTLGFWKQGLIPANKNEIGVKMGEEITTKLLKPEAISNEICQVISNKISDPVILNHLRTEVLTLFQAHKDKIVAFLLPKIQDSIIDTIDKAISVDNVKNFWDNVVEKWLKNGENHDKVARLIVGAIKIKSPELTQIAKTLLREKIDKWSYTKNIDSVISTIKSDFKLANELSEFINWKDVELAISEKIGEEKSLNLIRQEILNSAQNLRNWLDEDSSKQEMQIYIIGVKGYLERFIGKYIVEEIPRLIDQTLSSDLLWDWFYKEAIPFIKLRLEAWLETNGKEMIIENFNIENRIVEAVDKQDIAEFQKMIDNLASEHLGAIQVLGYILGLAAGLLLTLA